MGIQEIKYQTLNDDKSFMNLFYIYIYIWHFRPQTTYLNLLQIFSPNCPTYLYSSYCDTYPLISTVPFFSLKLESIPDYFYYINTEIDLDTALNSFNKEISLYNLVISFSSSTWTKGLQNFFSASDS